MDSYKNLKEMIGGFDLDNNVGLHPSGVPDSDKEALESHYRPTSPDMELEGSAHSARSVRSDLSARTYDSQGTPTGHETTHSTLTRRYRCFYLPPGTQFDAGGEVKVAVSYEYWYQSATTGVVVFRGATRELAGIQALGYIREARLLAEEKRGAVTAAKRRSDVTHEAHTGDVANELQDLLHTAETEPVAKRGRRMSALADELMRSTS
jgi:hypothetical protein